MDGRGPRGRTAQRTRRAALRYWATLHPKVVVPGFGGLIVTDVGMGGWVLTVTWLVSRFSGPSLHHLNAAEWPHIPLGRGAEDRAVVAQSGHGLSPGV
jgi:hypothetical protein